MVGDKQALSVTGSAQGHSAVREGMDKFISTFEFVERHILSELVEGGRTISENTNTALAAAKARGVKLGNPNGARALKGKQVGNAEAVAKLKATAAQRAADLKAIVEDIKRSGITTVRGIAEELHHAEEHDDGSLVVVIE